MDGLVPGEICVSMCIYIIYTHLYIHSNSVQVYLAQNQGCTERQIIACYREQSSDHDNLQRKEA